MEDGLEGYEGYGGHGEEESDEKDERGLGLESAPSVPISSVSLC